MKRVIVLPASAATLGPQESFEGAGFVVRQTRRKMGWRIRFFVTDQLAQILSFTIRRAACTSAFLPRCGRADLGDALVTHIRRLILRDSQLVHKVFPFPNGTKHR